MKRQLLFENGTRFVGDAFGSDAECVAEVVHNTAMVGYQELLTDPALMGTMLLMTYPLIGNCGLTDEDDESRAPHPSALIVREYNNSPTNYRYTKTLGDVMRDYGIPGLSGVDTRQITRMLLREGQMKALLTGLEREPDEGLQILRDTQNPRRLVKKISCKRPWYHRTPNYRHNVVVLDLGVKRSVIQHLSRRGCNVTVIPFDTCATEATALRADGILLPDGPGRADELPEVLSFVRASLGSVPMFGIGLGHQAIALANGARVSRLTYPHRGGNHPVRETLTNRVEITIQNHMSAVDPDSIEGTGLSASHRSLLDGSVEGLANSALHVMTAQFNPESVPGPRDSSDLFDRFVAAMERAGEEDEAHA
ncbi:MAG: carbamoyl phosphate synthase small subunit [Clostridia bacterium]|nr:carbamoyl phosphate synthase small subunit [Clostridia bacterium]